LSSGDPFVTIRFADEYVGKTCLHGKMVRYSIVKHEYSPVPPDIKVVDLLSFMGVFKQVEDRGVKLLGVGNSIRAGKYWRGTKRKPNLISQ
jgi:hypothetical protein